jgi:hypothetical protein
MYNKYIFTDITFIMCLCIYIRHRIVSSDSSKQRRGFLISGGCMAVGICMTSTCGGPKNSTNELLAWFGTTISHLLTATTFLTTSP